MQRAAITGKKVVLFGTAAAGSSAAGSSAHCRAPPGGPTTDRTHAPIRTVHEEEDWSFVGNWTSKPVTPAEVGVAVADLAALKGEEVDEVISDGSSADELIVAAETRTMMDSLSSVVTTLLNDPDIGRSVLDALAKDEGFRAMVEKYGGDATVLPTVTPAARPLLITCTPHNVEERANPLLTGLEVLLQSVAGAFCAFGNAIRRLHEDLIIVFREFRVQSSDIAHVLDERQGRERGRERGSGKGEWQAALMRLVTAVAVVVVARRVILSKVV